MPTLWHNYANSLARPCHRRGTVVSVSSKKVSSEYAVVVGTVGHNAFVDRLVAKGLLDVSAIRGGWEPVSYTHLDVYKRQEYILIMVTHDFSVCHRYGCVNCIFVRVSAIDFEIGTGNKRDWWQMIQLLPSSYNQTRNVMVNYEVLANIYKSRKDHKLDEWRNFCKWIEELPYSELIMGGKR